LSSRSARPPGRAGLRARLRIRVSEGASATVVLSAHGRQLLSARFAVKGGGNTLMAALPARLAAGSDAVAVTLTAASGASSVVRATVSVPA